MTNPKATKNLKSWKKGQSGNPKGKPKGTRNRSTIVRELLEAKATDGDGQVVDQVIRALIAKAMRGDVAAVRELMDSAYGKIQDEIEAGITYNLMPSIKKGGKPSVFDVGMQVPDRPLK